MILNKKQLKLVDFVKLKHKGQKRKYTGQDYWVHPYEVAYNVHHLEIPLSIEVALCHDLFEDTDCDFKKLHKELVGIGYKRRDAYNICTMVVELTDVFTKEDYPYYNRKKRKELEAQRLGGISYLAQTVKYSDLIDNTKSIMEYDKGFAKVYLKEKEDMLNVMVDGNWDLFNQCKEQIKIYDTIR